MNPESDNFDGVRRLLALKRHEQPPPGYFNTFSSQVISRIQAGETAGSHSLFARLAGDSSWWRSLAALVEAKPAFAGAFGAAVCALLISGIVYSENTPTPVVAGVIASESGSSLTPAPASTVAVADSLAPTQFISTDTNALSPGAGSIWDQIGYPKAQPVSFSVPASGN